MKAAVADLDQKQLLKVIADLYRLSKENQAFLHARYALGDDPLGPYKKTINECMCPGIHDTRPIQVSKAQKAISDYSKAVGDPLGEAELMTFFVECGIDFTVSYGDVDEAFYGALNRMYRRAIDKVLDLPAEQRAEFKDRLGAVMESSSGIGWSYHDMLCENYYKAFPEDERNR